MIVESGEPEFTGTYAVFLKGATACFAIRFWLPGHGWLTNLKEPLPGGTEIDGWIGPIPLRKLPPASKMLIEYNTSPKCPEPVEYDL